MQENSTITAWVSPSQQSRTWETQTLVVIENGKTCSGPEAICMQGQWTIINYMSSSYRFGSFRIFLESVLHIIIIIQNRQILSGCEFCEAKKTCSDFIIKPKTHAWCCNLRLPNLFSSGGRSMTNFLLMEFHGNSKACTSTALTSYIYRQCMA